MPRRRTMHQPRSVPLLALLALAACTAGMRPPSQVPQDSPAHRHVAAIGARDAITEVDIARTNATSAWDAVRTLRATFLASRGTTSFMRADGGATPAVFVDGMYAGPLSELRDIPASTIHEVRFLSAADATRRFGLGYAAGVIAVTTKR